MMLLGMPASVVELHRELALPGREASSKTKNVSKQGLKAPLFAQQWAFWAHGLVSAKGLVLGAPCRWVVHWLHKRAGRKSGQLDRWFWPHFPEKHCVDLSFFPDGRFHLIFFQVFKNCLFHEIKLSAQFVIAVVCRGHSRLQLRSWASVPLLESLTALCSKDFYFELSISRGCYKMVKNSTSKVIMPISQEGLHSKIPAKKREYGCWNLASLANQRVSRVDQACAFHPGKDEVLFCNDQT